MIPPAFDYHAPKTVGEALTLLGSLGSDAKLLAGGHSLLPMMKLRFAQPAHGDPANDHPALAIAVDAAFVLEGPKGRRSVKADAFFHGTDVTDLADDEILVAIRAPAFAAGTGWAYEKRKRKRVRRTAGRHRPVGSAQARRAGAQRRPRRQDQRRAWRA